MSWVYFFYEDVLITKYRGESLSFLTTYVEECGKACIIEGLKLNHKFPQQIEAYHKLLKQMVQRKKDKAGIYKQNHMLIMGCIAALVKLNQIPEYDAYIILKDKRIIKSFV